MNTDVEDLLRQGMTRFTADLRAPADMIRVAERRRSRRRLAQRSVTAVAVLAACVVALVAVAVPGARDSLIVRPKPTQTIDTAYLMKHVDDALTAVAPAQIAQMNVTTTALGSTSTAREWSYGNQWRSVVYSPAGQPLYETGGNSSLYTLISYSARTWSRASGIYGPGAPASGHGGCKQLASALFSLLRPGAPPLGVAAGAPPASVVSVLHAAISCGSLTEAGHQRVAGIEATELRSGKGSLISETIWVDPASYLPVRVVIRPAPGSLVTQHTVDISWHQPTARNLANLTVHIPAGFRQVPFSQVVRTISR
jgi:hypothetical protein